MKLDPTHRVRGTIAVSMLVFAVSVHAHEGSQPIEENHTVPDAVAAFEQLTERGEWLGFHRNDESPAANPPPFAHHFQGIARSPRIGQSPVIYATYSGAKDDDSDFGALMVVKMGSRPENGERLRSNRLQKGKETWETFPSGLDEVIAVYKTQDSGHPSGMSMVGDILAISSGPRIPDTGRGAEPPFEYSLCDPADPPCTRGRIRFYDSSDPTNLLPFPNASLTLVNLGEDSVVRDRNHGAWAVAITKLPEPDGRFFLAIPTGPGVYFYISNQTSFFDEGFEWRFHSSRNKQWLKQNLGQGYWPFRSDCGKGDHTFGLCHGGLHFESLQFVNETGGDLYLIGSGTYDTWTPISNQGGHEGQERMSLVRVTLYEDPVDGDESVVLEGVRNSTKQLKAAGGCHPYGFWEKSVWKETCKARNGSFNAGAGAYVTPSGELLYYSTTHWADLRPNEEFPRAAKFAELRHKEVSHLGTCPLQLPSDHLGGPQSIGEGTHLMLIGTVTEVPAWVDMFQHSNFTGYNVIMDYQDQLEDDYDDFSKLDGDFADRMTAFRWCGPEGATLRFFTEPIDAGNVWSWEKEGDGEVFPVANARDENINDTVEAARIDWNPQYQWSLQGPGSLTPVAGGRVIYNAGAPGTAVVSLTVSGQAVSTTIEVTDMPPTVYFLGPYEYPVYEGDEVSAAVWWWDYSATTVDVSVHWGDGWPATTLENQSGPVVYGAFRQVGFAYRYADDSLDEFYPMGCASDGIAESCNDSDPEGMFSTVIVHNVSPSVVATGPQGINEGAVLALEVVSFSDPGTLDTHTATIDWGDGTVGAGVVTESPFAPSLGVPAYGTVAGSHVYADDGAYTVTVTVTDDDGGVATDSFPVEVENVDPTIASTTNSAAACGDTPQDGRIEVSLDFEDPGFDSPSLGSLEDFTATIEWGDGTVDPTVVDETPGSEGTLTTGTLSGSHVYATGGIFTITITVEDDDGGTGSTTLTALVTGAGLTPEGLLGVVGTDFSDVVNISAKGSNIEVDAGFLSSKAGFPSIDVGSMRVLACDANDQIHVDHKVLTPAILEGGPGPDHIRAGSGLTELIGGEGDDHLFAGGSGNVLDGSAGDDDLNGRQGNDILLGGPGDDKLAGAQGDDVLDGGPGLDDCNPGKGADTVVNCEK